jgi:alkanesulfonate monooxygenase SsuD/methylene tetrahydromethanopterin reductase-like flavin-dependent oxidoreductase (luciferase family)
VAVQQAQVIAKLAPGRFRLGVGPSHRPSIERTFGYEFSSPLAHLREYVQVARTLIKEGQIDFDGRHYLAHARIDAPITDVPVMASALRAPSFRFCGESADGAISWMCPLPYLRDVALPALKMGAQSAGRGTPPLIAHVPVCVGGEPAEVRAAAREQFATYPRLPFYAQMFADAGYPEALDSLAWSDRMADEVIAHGPEKRVGDHLRNAFKWGAAEVLVSVLTVGADRHASWERTVRFLADLSKSG